MSYTTSVLDGGRSKGRVAMMQTIYEGLRDQWAEFRAQALKAYEYVVGSQIDPDVREQLKNEKRPALVFNLMQPKIITIAGLLESNKMYMRAVPIGEGDEQTADIHTQLVSDWAMRNCGGVREMSKAALDAAIGKIGWVNNYWSTKDTLEGKWYTESYDPFMILFDAEARKKDQSDWRYLIASGFYTCDEIIGIAGDSLSSETIALMREADERLNGAKTQDKVPSSWLERLTSGAIEFFERTVMRRGTQSYDSPIITDYIDTRVGRYRLIEFHDRRTKVMTVFYNVMTRESKVMDGDENGENIREKAVVQLAALNAMTGGGWIQRTIVRNQLWVCAAAPGLLADQVLYEKPYPVQGRGFQFKPVFCYDLHPDITKTQSLIDILIDPQDSYNQRRMTFLEWLMNAVNPDVLAPKNSIHPDDLATWQSKERGKIKLFTPQGGLGPVPVQPLAEGQALRVFSEEDRELAETLTNITPNTQGREENGSESGVLFAQKVQRALTALAYFFGNLQDAMKQVFAYTDANLQVFMDAPRKVRLLGPNNQPYWLQLNWPTLQGVMNDVTQGEYDFEADTVQLGETAKQVKFAEALAFVKSLPPELVKWDELFALWDSPVAQPMREFAAQMMGVMLQAQQAQQVAAAQQAQLQAVKGGAEAVGALESAAGTDEKTAIARTQAEAKMRGSGPNASMAGREVIQRGVA